MALGSDWLQATKGQPEKTGSTCEVIVTRNSPMSNPPVAGGTAGWTSSRTHTFTLDGPVVAAELTLLTLGIQDGDSQVVASCQVV